MQHDARTQRDQTLIGAGVLLVALGLAYGAWDIPADSGYGGVGPNFLPWIVSISLFLCGGFLLYEARSGGFREMDNADDADQPYWIGFVWMSCGLLLNAALITTIGFIFSCALCFVFAARGLRMSQGQALGGTGTWVNDVLVGFLIAAPVYWLFTKLLAINLPGITATGWL